MQHFYETNSFSDKIKKVTQLIFQIGDQRLRPTPETEI